MSTARPRIVVAGFQHETNTFMPRPTGLADFERGGGWPALTEGAEVVRLFSPLNIPIGGFLSAAASRAEIVPIFWTSAEPGGLVETAAFDRLTARIVDGVRAARPDAVYLDLHGAMVSVCHDDADAEVVARVRHAAGPDTPIAVSLDLHANVPERLASLADIVTIYQTYPHLDMAETGARAFALLDAVIRTGRRPHLAWRAVEPVFPLSAQHTEAPLLTAFYADVARGDDAPGLRSADAALGFPLADVAHAGPSVVAIAPEAADAEARADRLAEALAEVVDETPNPLATPAAAIDAGLTATARGGTAVLADVQDNSGAGAWSNSTGILHALLERGEGPALLGAFWDPDAARQANALGEGEDAVFTLGSGDDRLELQARVTALSNGRFVCRGAMQRDVETTVGPAALLSTAGGAVHVMVTSERHQIIDREAFAHLGAPPERYRIVVVKSTVHFRADFEPIARVVIPVAAPGLSVCRLETLDYRKLRPEARPAPRSA